MTVTIRLAASDDAAAIADLHNLNVRQPDSTGERGFLLAPVSAETVREALAGRTDYWVAATASSDLVGSLAIAQPRIALDYLESLEWHNNSSGTIGQRRCQDDLLSPQHRYLQSVSIHPDYMGRGIARRLYALLDDHYASCCLSAFVVVQPLCNTRSLRFHEQQGFVPVATFRSEEFCGLRDYASWLLYRPACEATSF